MVTYEITATVRADLCDAYEAYMREEHIPRPQVHRRLVLPSNAGRPIM